MGFVAEFGFGDSRLILAQAVQLRRIASQRQARVARPFRSGIASFGGQSIQAINCHHVDGSD